MHEIVVLIEELLAEAAHEITANPVTFAVELVQFGLLLFVIKAVAIRFRGKDGMLVGMLADRRERLRSSLEDAASAEEELDAARSITAQNLRRARSEARLIVAAARETAENEAAEQVGTLEAEESAILTDAEETLAKERAEMLGGVHEQLVDLVTQATRQVLDEGFSPAEQRALIQKSVVESLDDLESVSLH